MAIIGIDLGTTNSVVTAFQEGKHVLIPNGHGEYLTPSVVGLDENGALIVGKTAKERLVTGPHLTTSLFKRNMGTKTKVQLGNKSFLPEELSAFVLRQLIADAERFLGVPIEEAVISVPAYFNAKQRAATKRAGLLAGVKVERLLNEPSAAALACKSEGEDDTFLVFDFGGGTLDVSIVEVFDNVVNICAISGDNQLGGRDFDGVIMGAICAENGVDSESLTPQERESLLRLAEVSKIRLQTDEAVHMRARVQDRDIEMVLTNEKLTNLSWEIFARIKKPIQRVVQDSGLQASDISRCILVGGSCHMQIVQEYLGMLLRIPIAPNRDMDHVVAAGLGVFVGVKQRSQGVKDLVLTDICPFSLKTGVYNAADPQRPLSHTMIGRNSALPKRAANVFFTIELGQTEIGVTVSEGEQMYEADNTQLGQMTVKVPKNMKEHEQIETTFFYDINAILVVRVRVLSNGGEYTLVLTGDGLEVTDEKSKERHVRAIQEIAFVRPHDERHAFLVERAKRVYAEGDAALQAYMQEFITALEGIAEIGSMRKQGEKLDECEGYLEEIETLQGSSDIFRDYSDFTFWEDSAD